MYQHNRHSDMHRLSSLQQVSLDKHQHMIESALQWQSHHQQQVTAKEQTAARLRLSTVFAMLVSRLMK